MATPAISPFNLIGPGGRVTKYREAYFVSTDDSRAGETWGNYDARRARYDIFWAHFENNVYREVHRWAAEYKDDHDLYVFLRTIFSPANRIGEFWATHLLGGPLDPDAGDGKCKPSALPIEIPDRAEEMGRTPAEETARVSALRKIIALIWEVSNWVENKDIYAQQGSVLGDAFLAVVDDPKRKLTYLRVVHPATVRHVDVDAFGNVKGYIIQELRYDPRVALNAGTPGLVTYTEVAEREGQSVVYETFLDSHPYDWAAYPDGTPDSAKIGPQWTQPYGFVPMVKVQHRNKGLGWGWSELQADLSKLQELDDSASNLFDYIRVCRDAPTFFSGVANSGEETRNTDNGEVSDIAVEASGGRFGGLALRTANPNARAQSLVATLNIDAAMKAIGAILEEIEKSHPELSADPATASGSASGRALRVSREKVERVVSQRRAAYDSGQIRALQMAISIGAMKRYPAYAGFDATSYERGDIDFSIGDRPVFAVDEADRIEMATAFGTALGGLVKAGMSLESALKQMGVSEDRIKEILDSNEREATAAMSRQAARQRMMLADQDETLGADDPSLELASALGSGGESPILAVSLSGDGRYGGG